MFQENCSIIRRRALDVISKRWADAACAVSAGHQVHPLKVVVAEYARLLPKWHLLNTPRCKQVSSDSRTAGPAELFIRMT